MQATTLYINIDVIQRRKRAAHIVPDHAMYVEIIKEHRGIPRAEVNAALRELLNAGRIEVGRTANDWYIRTK